jgi:hypothetical protein
MEASSQSSAYMTFTENSLAVVYVGGGRNRRPESAE